MPSYRWQQYTCSYELQKSDSNATPLLLIHPIGVGLAGPFWQPFMDQWREHDPMGNQGRDLYVPDLLGCGQSELPRRPYSPRDWAEQLHCLISEVIQRPVILVVQGALLPVALELMADKTMAQGVAGAVLSGPPAWRLITEPTAPWRQRLNWSLFASPLGWGFYQYARRRGFLQSFSQRQLFARSEDVTEAWLAMLDQGSRDMATRYAVFSFLAGFWRQDYGAAIAASQKPILVIMGETASTIDRTAQDTTAQQRLTDYTSHFPQAQGVTIPGRNVLPYESTKEFIAVLRPFVNGL
ncbi:alpha/beta fold hydrolase [Leptothoe sp. PORK10 BA2]|uniref:alpha/beta fold hydrolase n=1 Tax=Leptothoe sp. PORK10 BA2 TaxID=3110254 RepID=UPI002B21EB97|nr:alpha/beta hydrolase [Leptothoe sp. PORK10 BA2]MEA5466651.1 alpha/beta hydrolase [Leptothoe sp. PORK10 BA2]